MTGNVDALRPSPGELDGLTVLIVEDNLDAATILRQMLEAAGARVVLARDGQEGLDALDRGHVGVVLADLLMPRMDGFEFIAAVRASRGRQLPVVAVTALGGSEDLHRTWTADFDAHLTKPVDHDLLLGVVSRLWAATPPPPSREAGGTRRPRGRRRRKAP